MEGLGLGNDELLRSLRGAFRSRYLILIMVAELTVAKPKMTAGRFRGVRLCSVSMHVLTTEISHLRDSIVVEVSTGLLRLIETSSREV